MSDEQKMPTVGCVSAKFNDPNAEIRFISSDGIVFNIHKKYLEATSEILQVPEHATLDSDSTRVHLTERSEILELLFQFVHPPSGDQQGRQPDLGELNPILFFDLAEAGEKYGVYSLKSVVIANMEVMISNSKHCIEVLNHCLRHSYYGRLIDRAAYQALSKPVADVVAGLSRLEDVQHWIRYYALYVDFGKSVTEEINKTIQRHPGCQYLIAFYRNYTKDVMENLVNVQHILSSPTDHTSALCPYLNYRSISECQRFQETLKTFMASHASALMPLSEVIAASRST